MTKIKNIMSFNYPSLDAIHVFEPRYQLVGLHAFDLKILTFMNIYVRNSTVPL